jgi:hypothetical protein
MRTVRAALGIVLAGVAFAPGAATAGLPTDGAVVARGAARTRPDAAHDWHDAAASEVVPPGTEVQAAGELALGLTLADGVSLTLEPGATIVLRAAGKLASETNQWTRGYRVVLESGEVDVVMPDGPKGANALLVSTSSGTFTDWRGALHLAATEETTAATVYYGTVVVGAARQSFPVHDATALVVRKNGDPDKAHAVPAVPAWDDSEAAASAPFAISPEGAPAKIAFAWSAVPGAIYRVEIATDAAMANVVRHAATADTRFVMPENAAATRYWARVRAIDADAIASPWSAPRALRVAHYKLPDGAFVAGDGVVVLPEGASVSLSDPAGLEVAYESVTSLAHRPGVPLYWAKPTGPLRRPDETPMRVVHLREAALGVETQMVLARRQLRADVDLQPRRLRWPDTPIDARVVAWDPSGRIDPAKEQLTVQAMLDLAPLPVAWQRTASPERAIWTARIPPRPVRGPSVVRVVVTDSLGVEVGRGFLEIEGH